MASTPLRVGFKMGRAVFTPKLGVFEIRCAAISSKAMRAGEPFDIPKPWDYKERSFTNLHAFIDGTTKRLNENSKVILVEGLPGIGKTEVAKGLAEELEMLHFPMVTMDNGYINDYGFDLRSLDPKLKPNMQSFDLEKFIKNPGDDKTPSLQFAMYYLKFFQYVDALAHVLNTGQGVVLERSPYSDMVFVEALYAMNWMTKPERKGYLGLRARTISSLMKPHLVVYLDASPDTVLENLKKRGKGEDKTLNKTYLEHLEKNYKEQFLHSISEHAELLVYDWNTPGDSEAIVEDIENIDFDRFDILDPKMGDWRLKEEWDWAEKRWHFTDYHPRSLMRHLFTTYYIPKAPRLYLDADESREYLDIVENAPGHKYLPGYNPDQGDNVLFRNKFYEFGLGKNK